MWRYQQYQTLMDLLNDIDWLVLHVSDAIISRLFTPVWTVILSQDSGRFLHLSLANKKWMLSTLGTFWIIKFCSSVSSESNCAHCIMQSHQYNCSYNFQFQTIAGIKRRGILYTNPCNVIVPILLSTITHLRMSLRVILI